MVVSVADVVDVVDVVGWCRWEPKANRKARSVSDFFFKLFFQFSHHVHGVVDDEKTGAGPPSNFPGRSRPIGRRLANDQCELAATDDESR